MTKSRYNILVVTGDEDFGQDIKTDLESEDWGVELCFEISDVAEEINDPKYACVIAHDWVASTRVRDVLTALNVGSKTPVVALIKSNDVKTAVDAMKLGARTVVEFDQEKNIDALHTAIDEALPKGAGPLKGHDPRDIIIRSDHSPLDELLDMLPPISRAQAPVLITGESGAGKELFARTIHNMSGRKNGPFIAVNCGAIPESLLESELFGYKKGAFTGAYADKMGFFEAAENGTLFLDEIGEMPPRLQVKILRVLQEHQVRPVGSNVTKEVNFRLVTATNRNLENEIKTGSFREDLFYRIAVLPLHLLPLRERLDDIPVLAEFFLDEQNKINGTSLKGFTAECRTYFKRYNWPGNIRELENLIQRVCILKRTGLVERDDLPNQITGSGKRNQELGLYVPSEGMDMAGTLGKLETHLVAEALKKTNGNKAKAARLLGLNRTTLVEKIKRLKINMDPT